MRTLDLPSLRVRFLAAQLAGNRREALRLLVAEGLALGATVRALQLEVVQEAQREIGRMWQENRVSIAQEHMATAVAQLALAHLYQQAEPGVELGRKVVVSCVAGEQHDFPARIAADVLELSGFNVRFLGADVPTDSLLATLDEEEPDLLALSVTMRFNMQSLRVAMPRIRAAQPTLPIIIGGRACAGDTGLAEEVGADFAGDDALALVAAARRLLGVAE